MEEISQIFKDNIDDLVRYSKFDSELADGIKWLDEEGRKQGLDFYQICKIVLEKHSAKQKARDWLKNKCMNN